MKTGIVGSGFVGATAAYALVMRGVGRRVVLVDQNTARAEAEADDILHAVPFAHPLKIAAGDYRDLADSKVVIVSAGVGQKPGETRLELLERLGDCHGDLRRLAPLSERRVREPTRSISPRTSGHRCPGSSSSRPTRCSG